MRKIDAFLDRHHRVLVWLILPILGFLLHLHVFNRDLQGIHAWRQCETASNVLRFANEGFGIHDPHVYSLEWEGGLKRMEFPVMQFAMAKVVQWVGHEILVMRLMSFGVGLIGLWGFYLLVMGIWNDKRLALLAAWCFMFSPVLFYYSVNPLPDNLALAAGIWGMALYVQAREKGVWTGHLMAAACFSLSTLAKLPFVLLMAMPAVDIFIRMVTGKEGRLRQFGFGLLYVLLLLPAASWYAKVIPTWHGNGVVNGILDMDASEWPAVLGTMFHHLISTLPELLLNYGSVMFFLGGLFLVLKRKRIYRNPLFIPFLTMAGACLAYFVFEINMIGTAHDYYLFPFLPGIFLLVVAGLEFSLRDSLPSIKIISLLCLISLPVLAMVRANPRWYKTGFPEDLLVHKQELQDLIPPNAKVLAGHDLSPHIFLYHLQRQGWSFSKHQIDSLQWQNRIQSGAGYLLSSDREIETNPVVNNSLKALVGGFGQLRVYTLKKQ
jgi:4-amino-4-deoxy-L-arabinose transferase-like glycosyltransferase